MERLFDPEARESQAQDPQRRRHVLVPTQPEGSDAQGGGINGHTCPRIWPQRSSSTQLGQPDLPDNLTPIRDLKDIRSVRGHAMDLKASPMEKDVLTATGPLRIV